MRRLAEPRNRAVSPVIGVALLLAIVIALGVVVSGLILGLADSDPASPESRLTLEGTGCSVELVHEQGNSLDGDHVRLRGTEDSTPLQGQRFGAGSRVIVQPTADEVIVVWRGPDNDSSYVLGRLEYDDGGAVCGEFLYAGDTGSLTSIGTSGDPLETLSIPGSVDALGPATADLLGDGDTDVPYVNASDAVRVADRDGSATTLATGSDIPGTIEGSKSRLATGRWSGSDPSVLFVNENHDTIYRVAEGGTPTAVATPGNGAQAVVGIADVDGDADDELVFADSSQQLRALNPDGSTDSLANGQLGSNNGIGAGALADFDGDGVHRAVGVDGSNQVKLVGAGTAAGGESTTVLTGGVARKSPATVADVDADGTPEIVFVSMDSEKLKYVDDVGGANTVAPLIDANGDPIQRSEETGVV